MKNLTISLPESTLEALRSKAKANGKSLNAWLREVLGREAASDIEWLADWRRATDRCAEAVKSSDAPEWKWNRDEIYEERLR